MSTERCSGNRQSCPKPVAFVDKNGHGYCARHADHLPKWARVPVGQERPRHKGHFGEPEKTARR
jgi:hypothetical protein